MKKSELQEKCSSLSPSFCTNLRRKLRLYQLPIAEEVAAESATENNLLVSRGFVTLQKIRLERERGTLPERRDRRKGSASPLPQKKSAVEEKATKRAKG